ncbi:MAG: 60S ribosomal protein L31 [Candidatus Nitrosopelagicus sp.]|nr:60S ribosomal protein L31 [Candidatus Nitrosopelagicus sp.]
MSQELERVYTIPLGKVLLSQSQHRAVRAINMIREFARKHMKTQEIKIDEEVTHLIWSKGVRSPPRKIRVKLTKTDDGYILVTNYQDDAESDEKDSKKSPEIEQKVEPQTDDADAIEVTEETLKAEAPKAKESKPTVEKPKAKESKPKVEKPKSKESKPKVEKPKAKESKPKVEKPKAKESKPKVEKPKAKESKPKVEKPKAKESKPKVEKPKE